MSGPTSQVTTHVLDTARGRPAEGVDVVIEGEQGTLGSGRTDADGRVRDLGPRELPPGTYRLRFDTGGWSARSGHPCFFPEVVVAFAVTDEQHLHVPLLLSPFAYSTYRGS